MELAMRKDVPEELTWDISAIYPTEEALLADSKKMKNLAEEIEKTYKGKLDTPERIHDCMEQYQEVVKLDVLTATYCELAVSVDYYNAHNQEISDRIAQTTAQVLSRLSFVEGCCGSGRSRETLSAGRDPS